MLDPLTGMVEEVSSYLAEVLGEDKESVRKLISRPSRPEYGDLSFPLIRYLRKEPASPDALIETLRGRLWEQGYRFADLRLVGGFLNIYIDEEELGREVLSLLSAGWRPRVPESGKPATIVVEHTSANPVHPLHIGTARNSSLGDSIARLLKSRGHKVVTRFYIDDVGRQTAIAALGFKYAGEDPRSLAKKLKVKVDHLVGWVYSVTHTLLDLAEAKVKGGERVEELVSHLKRLRDGGFPEVYEKIASAVESSEDPESEVSRLMRDYESGAAYARSLVRSVAEACIEGFRETLSSMGVDFDFWDWESDLVWRGIVSEILDRARESRYVALHKGALALDLPRVVKELVLSSKEYSEKIKLPRGFEIPPLILVRSDGTTLYWTRDIAYTIYKFKSSGADRVINVIGADQRVIQLQVRLSLLALGYVHEALNTMHYDYEMVNLPGQAISGRRGVYITVDEILDSLKSLAREEVRKRNPGAGDKWVEDVAGKVSVGALRFSLVQAGPSKPMVFRAERVVDFTQNSGPYIQYTYARAHNILEKHGDPDFGSASPLGFTGDYRRPVFIESIRLPLVAAKAADDLSPEDLASHLLLMADLFNRWYDKDSVIHERNEGVREAKASMVYLFRESLGLGMDLLGIPRIERM